MRRKLFVKDEIPLPDPQERFEEIEKRIAESGQPLGPVYHLFYTEERPGGELQVNLWCRNRRPMDHARGNFALALGQALDADHAAVWGLHLYNLLAAKAYSPGVRLAMLCVPIRPAYTGWTEVAGAMRYARNPPLLFLTASEHPWELSDWMEAKWDIYKNGYVHSGEAQGFAPEWCTNYGDGKEKWEQVNPSAIYLSGDGA